MCEPEIDQRAQINLQLLFKTEKKTTMCRCNGHRDKFKVHKFDQSALSLHIMEEHEEYFHEKLNNFDFGVVKQVSSQNLNRCEDFYIWHTKADKDGLNRYKVSK